MKSESSTESRRLNTMTLLARMDLAAWIGEDAGARQCFSVRMDLGHERIVMKGGDGESSAKLVDLVLGNGPWT